MRQPFLLVLLCTGVLPGTGVLLGTGAVAGVADAKTTKSPHWQVTSLERLLVQSADPLRRESAALALGRRGSPTAVGVLTEALAKDKDRWVRARCAEALGMIGDERAVKPLLSALAREKHQRVRRVVAEALVRLGRREGLLELLWQLRSGTNHSKAEAMKGLVSTTGRPLGQRVNDWWSYLAARGYNKLGRRPRGAPAIFELGGLPRIVVPGSNPAPWRVLPTVVVRLKPGRKPITGHVLRAYEGWHGPIADGCLVLIDSGWAHPAARPSAGKQGKAPRRPTGRGPVGPGLTLGAIKHLFERAPNLLGVGVDAPALDLPSASARGTHPVRDYLVAKGRLAIEQVADLDRLNATGTRILLVNGPSRPRLLGILP